MKIAAIILLALWSTACFGQDASVSSKVDPFVLVPGAGEMPAAGSNVGLSNATGRGLRSSTLPSTAAVVITAWQSLAESSGEGYAATTQANSLNLSIYDGGLYNCSIPVLGTPQNGGNVNSINCQIADLLIAAYGLYTHVAVMPIAIGSTLCSDWAPGGPLAKRVQVALDRLASRGYTAATGFAGDVWILPHGGENDAVAGTPRATLAACIRSFAASFAVGLGSARFFVPTESMVNNATNATVTGAQADAVASGCPTCRQGANFDSLTGSTNRQTDGTHLTQTGTYNAAVLDATVIYNCKMASC